MSVECGTIAANSALSSDTPKNRCKRNSAPVSSRDVTLRLMASKGLNPKDKKLRDTVQNSVRSSLMGYRRRGVLEQVGTGWETRWRLADRPGEQA